MPNGFTRPIVPHQQPGYPGVMYGPHRFPGSVFPFGMNDQNSQFGLNWNNYGNYQNQLTLDQRAPQPGSNVNNANSLNTGVDANSRSIMNYAAPSVNSIVKPGDEDKISNSVPKESEKGKDDISAQEIALRVSTLLTDNNMFKNAFSKQRHSAANSASAKSSDTATTATNDFTESIDETAEIDVGDQYQNSSDTESEDSDDEMLNTEVEKTTNVRYLKREYTVQLKITHVRPVCFLSSDL